MQKQKIKRKKKSNIIENKTNQPQI